MKLYSTISIILIPLVIVFGIIDNSNEQKENLEIYFKALIGLILFLHIILKKKFLFKDVGILILVLLSTIGLSNFVWDLIVPPVTMADTCAGHHAMEFHWLKGFIIGPIMTIILGVGYLRRNENQDKIFRALLLLPVLTLILVILNLSFLERLNEIIDKISIPEVILPHGC